MEQPIYTDHKVTITPTLAVIDGTTYAIQTINSISVQKLPGGFGLMHFIMIALGVAAVLLSFGGFQSRDTGPAFVVLFIGIALIVPGARAAGRESGYSLTLATSSGDRQALISKDSAYLGTLRRYLEAAIASAREVKPAAALAADTKDCPRCAETIKAAAKACRFCGYEYDKEPATIDG
ncbi:DUF6232 family protein [Azospirillum soli]|uniref:DUF6232 family protein n=1 Tax=Azospirillum soli TaxID=1304799 RepID=UPI001AE8C907|nr:DUF6232 family protein [Azospirillum soli]MBP2311868.1 hypothetical protein [Azospirillum soli]